MLRWTLRGDEKRGDGREGDKRDVERYQRRDKIMMLEGYVTTWEQAALSLSLLLPLFPFTFIYVCCSQ